MPTETSKEIELEIAYVLFVDIVGYSKLVTSEQRRRLELLNGIVRKAEHFRAAEAKNRLISVLGRTSRYRERLRTVATCGGALKSASKKQRTFASIIALLTN